jgi:hypothetical protein
MVLLSVFDASLLLHYDSDFITSWLPFHVQQKLDTGFLPGVHCVPFSPHPLRGHFTVEEIKEYVQLCSNGGDAEACEFLLKYHFDRVLIFNVMAFLRNGFYTVGGLSSSLDSREWETVQCT